jgi:uncharacterized protein (UPF0276 family)
VASFVAYGPTKLGLAYSSYVDRFLREHDGEIDFVEIPFELVHYDRRPLGLPDDMPLLLHCSSLSLAGNHRPNNDIVDSVSKWVQKTRVPWLSEHLAFVTAGPPSYADPSLDRPFDVGYSINPPLNTETAHRVVRAVERYEHRFGVPLVLENPPVYFAPPGTTMTPTEFARVICDSCQTARLLVDLAHLFLSCRNLCLDPVKELLALPLDRIDEIHISGVTERGGAWWDDHTLPAPDDVHDLLAIVLQRAHISAVTLEYNWSGNFPIAVLLNEIENARGSMARAAV